MEYSAFFSISQEKRRGHTAHWFHRMAYAITHTNPGDRNAIRNEAIKEKLHENPHPQIVVQDSKMAKKDDTAIQSEYVVCGIVRYVDMLEGRRFKVCGRNMVQEAIPLKHHSISTRTLSDDIGID